MMEGHEEEFVVVLSSKTIHWLTYCPLPLWRDPNGDLHYLQGLMADDGRGTKCMVFIERPMPEEHAKGLERV